MKRWEFFALPIGDEKIKCKYIQCFYLQSILLICGWNQVLRFVQPISFSFSFRCAGALANRTRPVSLRSALPIQDMKIHSANIGTDVFISWKAVADRISWMTFRFTLHRLFKKLIISANTIGAVISDRYNLTPLRLIVMTMPIQKAVTSGNGNIMFYRESTRSNCK